MTGHRSFEELREGMSPARRARNRQATAGMLHEMALHELRRARDKSQQELARDLHVGQTAVARLERRADMYVRNCGATSRRSAAPEDHRPLSGRFGDDHNFEELATPKEQRPL